MRHAREMAAFAVTAVVVISLLLFIGCRERPEAPGDDTPLEHEMGGDPPPEVREP